MGKHGIYTGCRLYCSIKKCLTEEKLKSIAFAMMLIAARRFEHFQTHPLLSWYTDSGFSGEDLVSDLVGFYRIIDEITDLPSYLALFEPVSKEAALRRWDHYGPIGKWKNTSFQPLLFPDPKDCPDCKQPNFGKLPDFLNSIKPYNMRGSGHVIRWGMDDVDPKLINLPSLPSFTPHPRWLEHIILDRRRINDFVGGVSFYWGKR